MKKKKKKSLSVNHKFSFLKTNKLTGHNKAVSSESLAEEQKKLEDYFRQGREEYLNLFKTCPVPLLYTDIEGTVLYANHCFEALTGFQENELKGNTLIWCLKSEENSFLDTKDEISFETTICAKDHTQIEVLVKRTCNQTANRIAGMIFSFQDISLLKRGRKTNKALYHISKITHSHLPLSEMFSLVHEQLKNVITATNFYIALHNAGQGQLSFPYYTDEAAGDDEIFIQRYCDKQSIFHYVLKIGKPVLMDFQRYRKMLSYGYIEPWDVMTNTHLWLAVPLKLGQDTIGVLALQSYNNARLYSEKDIDLLEFAAQQISAALYREEKESQKKDGEKGSIEIGDKMKDKDIVIKDNKEE